MNSEDISLYFHIPFCTQKCDYCHFYVLPDKETFKQQLMDGIEIEIQKRKSLLTQKNLISIYFGGGTPSLLGPERLQQLLEKVQATLPFRRNSLEITLEVNPENVTLELMQAYAAVGVNRVSMGIQTLDTELLEKLRRSHNADTAQQAIYLTAEAGIANLSIDLMYDIPGQTLTSWKNTLEQVARLPISHLSLYNLTIEPHTVFFKYQEKLRKEMPDASSSASMYQLAVETFENQGLAQYEISAFARKDCFSRHNVGYWTARPFLGFGPSAFSYWQGKRFRNIAHLNKYTKMLEQGTLPIDFEEELTPDQRRRELLAIALRLLKGIDRLEFEKKHGLLETATHEAIHRLKNAGLLSCFKNKIALTTQGVLFYDTVAVEII